MAERVKIRFNNGKGNISDTYTLIIDGDEWGSFSIIEKPLRWENGIEKQILFMWNPLNNAVYDTTLHIQPQDAVLILKKNIRDFSKQTAKGEKE